MKEFFLVSFETQCVGASGCHEGTDRVWGPRKWWTVFTEVMAGYVGCRARLKPSRLGFSRALQPTSDASIFLRGTIMPQNSGNCYERGNHYAILVSYIMTTVTLGAVFTISSWRAPHAVHASSICPRSLPPSQRWHLLKDQQQCEFGEALRWKAAEIRGNAWSTLQVEAQVFQHQNVSPNSFNIETPTKTHLAPVFWTTVLLTRPQIPQTTELCWWRVDMAHGHTCFIRQRSLSWHVGWWSTAMSMWQQL